MSEDVVNFEVGAKSHMHWVKPIVVDGQLAFTVCEPFSPDTIQIFMDGERCAVCPPPTVQRGVATVVGVDREAGIITMEAWKRT